MPGKTEVQHVKDHYPESVVWDSIVCSLKGAAVDMARYIGLTASMAHIFLQILAYFWHSSIIQCADAKFL